MKHWAVCLLAAALACAHGKPAPEAAPPSNPKQRGVEVEDSLRGVRYQLPAGEEIWQVSRDGEARTASGVEAEIASFPLPKAATPKACRDRERERMAKDEAAETPHEEVVSDEPAASWTYSSGADAAQLRKRLAFYARGSDCLVLRISGAKGDKFADYTFAQASKSMKILPLPSERQRDVDLMAGASFLERRDPEAALDRFEALAQREPAFTKAHYGALLAGFAMGVKGYARALPHGLAALRSERDLQPEQRQLLLRAVGVMQLAQNQIRAAADTLAELVVRSPELAEGQYNYACALARLGDAPAAMDHLRKAVQLDGDLVTQAQGDDDLKSLHGQADFERLIRSSSR
jgi:tetratricopeptide (TPR) repeat protein